MRLPPTFRRAGSRHRAGGGPASFVIRMAEPCSADVIVVGAGVAGLSCAVALARAGLRVIVLERTAEPGGRARSWVDSRTGTDVDIGPHVVTSEHRNFMRLLRHLGTADQVLWQPDVLITLLDAGERMRMVNHRWPAPLHGLPWLPQALRRLSWADGLSHLRVAWAAARANEASLRTLDTLDALSWLRGMGVRERAIDWFWRSGMLALLNAPLQECSAAAVMRVFRLMLGRSGYHFGFAKVGLSQLCARPAIPAVETAGGQVLFKADVQALVIDGGRTTGVRLRGGRTLSASHCVLAVPPSVAGPLLGEAGLADLARRSASFVPSPYISTVLWFDRPLTGERFWARVWAPRDLNTDFYDLRNIRPSLKGSGSVIACNAIGPQVRPDWGDRRIIERSLQELAEFAPATLRARLIHAHVERTAMGIPMPRPGTETARPPTRTPSPGLLMAGDWIDTAIPCSMESAARSGALAAEAVLQDRGLAVQLALDPPGTQGLVRMLRRPTRSQ